jgi:hypothetical protein
VFIGPVVMIKETVSRPMPGDQFNETFIHYFDADRAKERYCSDSASADMAVSWSYLM